MQAFMVFTFDKAVSNMFKSISTLKNDNLAYESWRLFKKYEDAPVQYKEDIYYNDFIRIIPVGGENEVYVRLVHCTKTGIITCHGFNFEPFTNDISLAQKMKDYRSEFNKRNEALGIISTDEFSL
mmetsp:Transcript_26771/g.23631  ORF Transcript_26771/g.23631 Transcript_26771/m.23631 type:complete len:125 (+) Transcript_26771:79-453(+)